MRIVILGDFHYSDLSEKNKIKDKEIFETRDKYYEEIISSFLNTNGDYHIALGDLTDFGNKEELKYVCGAMKNNGVNFIHVIGNHDSYNSSKRDILNETKQERYFSIDKDDKKLIFIDSTLETNRECCGGSIDEEQLTWLENEIIVSEGKTVLIFSHHPVYDTTALSKEKNLYIREIEELDRILSLHKGRGIFFNGHNHVNSIFKRENWHFVQTGAILDINAFRVVDIKEDKINFNYKRVHEVSAFSKFIGTNMKHFYIKDGAKGNEEDRVLCICN
ncbi:metallophosphoesterase family protein [Clostridium vincentii]|uniref:Cyclic 3',5'-adenosine monophosphate phosphodiesterase n=1 Tax=Clostridium vincentii TaxID=52704 RepID=A0A2T0BIV9_9CLOT|nr:metallophosphoesterase [Clostridium vincentii]PRR83787.1 cyclic 3',5'-adenosine monophosphate phosphodiesterase [Clostridium vincentii]